MAYPPYRWPRRFGLDPLAAHAARGLIRANRNSKAVSEPSRAARGWRTPPVWCQPHARHRFMPHPALRRTSPPCSSRFRMRATSGASSKNMRHWQMSTQSGDCTVSYRRMTRRSTCTARAWARCGVSGGESGSDAGRPCRAPGTRLERVASGRDYQTDRPKDPSENSGFGGAGGRAAGVGVKTHHRALG
jgi:hypothetical protein